MGGEGGKEGRGIFNGAGVVWTSLCSCSSSSSSLDVKVPQIQFIDRVLACSCATEAFDAKNASMVVVCAAKESSDNIGLVELDEDGKEQIVGAIKDGQSGADVWVDVAVIMQRQVQQEERDRKRRKRKKTEKERGEDGRGETRQEQIKRADERQDEKEERRNYDFS